MKPEQISFPSAIASAREDPGTWLDRRARETYEGFVVGLADREKDPRWKIQITSQGELQNRFAFVDRENVPSWIRANALVSFELLAIGRNKTLIAINVERRLI